MILTCAQMKAAEDALFATGVEAEGLMDKAGQGCAEAIRQFFPKPAEAILFVGKGHNGGDAFVIGRQLRLAGWRVSAQLAVSREELAPLTRKKLAEFETTPEPRKPAAAGLMLVDGLLGIGASGSPRGSLGELADEMNRLRVVRAATCFAVDIPSGVDGDSGEPYEGAVIADVTLAISHVKSGLLDDRAIDHVGRLALIPLPELTSDEGDQTRVSLHSDQLSQILSPAPFSTHKSAAGRVGIIAGARGFTGAAILTGLGALRSGGGLITLYAREDYYDLLAAKAPPEIMVKPIRTLAEIADDDLHAIAIGPGLTTEHSDEVVDFIQKDPRPMIVDADALNCIAQTPGALESLPHNRLLTPHPGEMKRLFPAAAGTRLETAREFVARHPNTLLYKGARTIIAAPEEKTAYNTTGQPGMATGGIGDALTGVCAALVARGTSLFDAACLGSWLIGRAAEIHRWENGQSPEGLAASDVAQLLPTAMQSLRQGCY
ncbi:MAG: NAD(P)H-hydrate dehydratase [Verrucomicrobiota bacterium]